MPEQTLRQLARAHARGELDQTEYRKARARLIEGILAGDISLRENDYLTPVDAEPGEETVEAVPERSKPGGGAGESGDPFDDSDPFMQIADFDLPKKYEAPPPRAGNKKWIAAVAGTILVLIPLLVYYLASSSDQAAGRDTAAGHERPSQSAIAAANSAAARELILAFLKERSWSRESIESFISDWQTLEPVQRRAAHDTVAMSRLGNAIYKQFLAEKALSELDDGDAARRKQRLLVDFAERLNIDDPRLTLPEENDGTPAGDAEGGKETVLQDSREQGSLSACRLSLLQSRAPYCRDPIADTGDYGPTMVMIPPGRYLMGGEDERPRHEVRIDYGFALSVHEITFGEFSRFCDMTGRSCPGQPWFGADYPVVNVSWHLARDYARWLTRQTGNPYRLPSEAEWEYAARAGLDGSETGPASPGQAVFAGERDWNGPLPKTERSIERNRFRLYHMLGNVREWTADHWHQDYSGAPVDGSAWRDNHSGFRVVRGGSYADARKMVRYAARVRLAADDADRYTGFRVLQEVDNG